MPYTISLLKFTRCLTNWLTFEVTACIVLFSCPLPFDQLPSFNLSSLYISMGAAAAFFFCYHYYYCNWGGEDCPYLILKFGLWIFVTTQLICEVFRTERVGGVRTEEGVLRIITNAMSFQFIIDSPLSFPYIIPKFYVKGGGEKRNAI